MHHRKAYMYINFQKNWVDRYPTIKPILGSIDLLDVKLPQQEIIYTDCRQTISSLFSLKKI